ncbi:hypothetical protein [Thalassomonas sp. RHCl1]|nr:hypothetical protein [Thalassomonas sp. RHCl1]
MTKLLPGTKRLIGAIFLPLLAYSCPSLAGDHGAHVHGYAELSHGK